MPYVCIYVYLKKGERPFFIINCNPLSPLGRAPFPAHWHLLQASYVSKSTSCLSLCLSLIPSALRHKEPDPQEVQTSGKCVLIKRS